MRFRIEQDFDLPLAQVEHTLCDPKFIEAMGRLPKLGRPALLSREDDGEIVRMQVRYAFVGELSSSVRRVVDPARLTWVEDVTTDRRTHRASFVIRPDHYAGLLKADGRFTLTPDGETRCRRVTEGQVTVSVPLVGSKVERAIVSGLEEHAAAEADLVTLTA